MNSEEIIKMFQDEYGYVSNIKAVATYLQDKNIPLDQTNRILFDILKHNLSVDLRHKESFKESKKNVPTTKQEEVVEEPVIVPKQIKSEVFDVLSYINSIKECEDLDFVTDLLPTNYDPNYDTIISSILLYLLREIQLAHEMLSLEDDEEFRELIEKNRQLIEIIKNYNIEEEQEEVEFEEHKNKLIFLTKPNGSLYVDDDLAEIKEEDIMLQAISDFENNKITKEKRFINCEQLKGLSGFRKNNARIIFVRLDNDVICVLAILVKRFQNTMPYREMLINRSKELKSQIDALKESIQDEGFIKENQDILGRIKESLKGNVKAKKAGDNNG